MSSGHGIGIPGVEIESHDHVCALFDGQAQRDEILFSFLHAGLDDGDKCMVVVDGDPSDVYERLADPTEIDEWLETGALDVRAASTLGRPDDPLDVDAMLGMWDALIRYESRLTGYIPDRLAVLCLYDVAEVGGSLLIDAVRTHPRLLVGSVVIENPPAGQRWAGCAQGLGRGSRIATILGCTRRPGSRAEGRASVVRFEALFPPCPGPGPRRVRSRKSSKNLVWTASRWVSPRDRVGGAVLGVSLPEPEHPTTRICREACYPDTEDVAFPGQPNGGKPRCPKSAHSVWSASVRSCASGMPSGCSWASRG